MAEGNRNFVDQIYVTDGESSDNGQIIDIGAKAENVYFKDNVTLPNKLAEIANNSALTSKSQINITTDKVTSIVLNDSSDYNIVNLICDKKDNNNQIAFYRKNLFDFSVCDINTNDLAIVNNVDRDNCTINFTTNGTDIYSGIYFRHIDLNSLKGYGIDYTKLNGKPVTLSFDAQSDIDCEMAVQFTRSSYTSINISSTKQRFYVTEVVDMSKLNKAICFYLNSVEATVTISNIQIEVNNTATDYEDCDCQKVTLANADVNSLHTYYPSTTVISDSDFILTYIADIKNYIDNNLDTKENISNKIDTIDFPSTTFYPSSKAVWDYVTSKISTLINNIENLKNNKVNITDFNIFKDTTNQAIASHSTNINTNAKSIKTMKADLDKKEKFIKNLTIKNTTEKSTSVVLNDSSDCNIVDLICDEKDNRKQIAFYRKNLFDFNIIRVNGIGSVSNIVVNKDNKSISFTTPETDANSGVYIRHINDLNNKGYGIDYTKLSGKPVALSFDIQSDINCKIVIQFIQLIYNYFDITPTKQRIVVTDTVDINKLSKALSFYTNKTKANITISNIQIEVNNTATDYEDCDCQKVTLANADVNSLHTYYPSTTVIADSDVQLSYVADTKHYIDNKFNELATAIVAHESGVN